MLDMKRREFIALVGSGGLLAAMNKCLAPSNKSRTGGKATQERERLKCSVGSNARDDRGLAVARHHAVGPFPSDDHKNIFKQCRSAKGRIIVYDRGVRLDSEQFRSAPRTCRPVSGSLLPANRLPWVVGQRGGHFLPGNKANNQHEAAGLHCAHRRRARAAARDARAGMAH